jgi:hypothetical protein
MAERENIHTLSNDELMSNTQFGISELFILDRKAYNLELGRACFKTPSNFYHHISDNIRLRIVTYCGQHHISFDL